MSKDDEYAKQKLIIPKDTKLLVTSNRYFELDAASEIWHALRATGICDEAEIVFIRKGKWWLRGIIGVIFEGDAIFAIEKIRNYFVKRPWIMEYSQRVIPIEIVTTDINELKDFVKKRGQERISEKDRWMIKITKHDSKIKRRHLIDELASLIDKGKVDLSNPKWIINVEVIKNTFACAIIEKHHILRKKELKNMIGMK